MSSHPPEVIGTIFLIGLFTLIVYALLEDKLKDSSSTPEDLTSLSPTDFEYRVADYYKSKGYDTLVTRQSGEDGVDVIARKDPDPLEFQIGSKSTQVELEQREEIAIQAKRYQTDYQVGASIVERTHDAQHRVGADSAAVVTSSSFTEEAHDRARRLGVDLVNGRQMAREL